MSVLLFETGSLIRDDEEFEVDEVTDGAEHFAAWFPTNCPIVASLTLIKSVELANSSDDAADTTSTVLRWVRRGYVYYFLFFYVFNLRDVLSIVFVRMLKLRSVSNCHTTEKSRWCTVIIS